VLQKLVFNKASVLYS